MISLSSLMISNPEVNWGESDTHFAFTMHFGIDLIILHPQRNEVINYRFSSAGPFTTPNESNPAVVGLYTGDNHYDAIEEAQ